MSADPPPEVPAGETPGLPARRDAIHLDASALPYVDAGGGNMFKVLQVDLAAGLWIVEEILRAGMAGTQHHHTGPVYGYTTSGAWKYREYDYVNRAGSFLFEPAGSRHTMECIEDDTHIWFQIYGANLNLDERGSVVSIEDASSILRRYYALCELAGLPRPDVIGV